MGKLISTRSDYYRLKILETIKKYDILFKDKNEFEYFIDDLSNELIEERIAIELFKNKIFNKILNEIKKIDKTI